MMTLIAQRCARAFAIAFALLLGACGGSVELLSNLRESEANEVIGALSQSGIQATKVAGKDGAVNLTVSPSDVARSIRLLADEGLPRERRSSMGEVFRKEGLISSPLEERARYLWALSQELSETVAQIDGVVRARVHVVLPERSTGGDPPLPSSAAVFVKHRSNVVLDDVVPQIRKLVSASIPGLQPEKVSVVLVPAGAKVSSSAQAGQTAPARHGTPGWLYGLLALVTVGGFGTAAWQVYRSRKAPASATAQAVDPSSPTAAG